MTECEYSFESLECNIKFLINSVNSLQRGLKECKNEKNIYFKEWENSLKILANTQELLSEKTNRVYKLELELMNVTSSMSSINLSESLKNE